MALTSVYYDGPVTETDRAKNLAGAAEYGVYGPGDFKVTAHPSIPYAVLVKAGRAHGHGVTDTAAEDQVVQCDPISSGTRWDLITVRRDWRNALGGPSTLMALQAGADPAIPATRKVGPGVEDDQPLFLVKWQGGTSAPIQFIDLRVWAGNGGLFANDDMVRTYLSTVGTEVNIKGAIWRLTIGANESLAWVKSGETGKIPLFGAGSPVMGGPVPPPGAQFFIQSGSKVSNADAAGYAAVEFPNPFPNGVLYANAENGDASIDAVRGTMIQLPNAGAPDWPNPVTLTRFVYAVESWSGTKIPGALHRANWIAIGW